MGYYGRGRRRKSSRDYGRERATAHINEASIFSNEVGSADDIVKGAFFSLSGKALDFLLTKYGELYGEAARDYARQTIPKWRSGSVQMSGMVAQRLFDLMPPLMPTSQKHQIVEAIWKRYGPRSSKYVYVGPGSNPDAVLLEIERYFANLNVLHVIPPNLESRFDWLADHDVAAKQMLLNHFMDQQRRVAISSARLNLQMMLASMNLDQQGQITKLSHAVFVGNHQLEIKADQLRSGFILSDLPNAFIRPPMKFPWAGFFVVAAVVTTFVVGINLTSHAPAQKPASAAQQPTISQPQQNAANSEPAARPDPTDGPATTAAPAQVDPPSAVQHAAIPPPVAATTTAMTTQKRAPDPANDHSRSTNSAAATAPEGACNQTVIASVEDDGATVRLSNGSTYTISTNGVMRYSAAQWSTGDTVTACLTRGIDGTTAASISNPAHYDKLQATLESSGGESEVSCDDERLTRVADGGSSVDASGGGAYEVSSAGVMRYSAAQWSTGDAVQICRTSLSNGNVAVSIANPAHYDKLQATLVAQNRATTVTCRDTSIASVGDGGNGVRTSDGVTYAVANLGVMRYSVQQWSTGDRINVCESKAPDGSMAASIANPSHFDKVQAART
jgi:hypothetical protein